MKWQGNYLQPLNHECASFEELASTDCIDLKNRYYCTSNKCCTVLKEEKPIFNKKKNDYEMYKTYTVLNRIFKISSFDRILNCPDCQQTLVIR